MRVEFRVGQGMKVRMEKKNIKKEVKYYLVKDLLALPVYYFVKIYSHTLRIKLENAESYLEHLERGGRVVFACWHQRFFGGFYFPNLFGWHISIMISQSRDGDCIAEAVRRIGWIPVRGSSSRGGKVALQKMVDVVLASRIGVHIVDGPTGPPRVIKPGLITLAQKAGAAISPAYVIYDNPIMMKSWDRFMIPRPFSRVLIRMGPLRFVPESADEHAFEVCRAKIENDMKTGYEEADAYWSKKGNRNECRLLPLLKRKIRPVPLSV